MSILRPTGAVSVHFELFWGLLCHLLIFRVNCGASRIHSEWFWGHSHVSGAIPGPFVSVWAHLTSAWVTLRQFWSIRSDVGALWGKFLSVLSLFGAISVHFGQCVPISGPTVSIWVHLWLIWCTFDHRIIEPPRLEKISKIIQSSHQPNPPCPLTMSISATSPCSLNTARDSDCPTSLRSCATASPLILRFFFLIFLSAFFPVEI